MSPQSRPRERPGLADAPRATYRIQLRDGVTLERVHDLVPYLEALGVSHVYLSPVMRAHSGSAHGYDVVDPTSLDPAVGSEAEMEALAAALRARGMAILLDWVPNHLGVGGHENAWWLDLLAFGRGSPYADFFDIDWEAPGLDGKLLLPFLGAPLGDVLERRELRLVFDAASGSAGAWYHEHCFPLAPRDIPGLLAPDGSAPESIASLLDDLRRVRGPGARAEARSLQAQLARALGARPALADWAQGQIERAAADRPRVAALLERQAYRPAFWREADERINYRRFFDVSDLAALRMDREEVFDAVHAKLLEWFEHGLVQGLRIDHIDGLLDPLGYLERLRTVFRDSPLYLVVEKILEGEESLRAAWPVEGTTGYEFLNLTNGLFVDPEGERALEQTYRRASGRTESFDEILADSKRHVLAHLFGSELRRLCDALDALARALEESPPADARRAALEEVLVAFPIYRSYVTPRGADAEDRAAIDRALASARRARPELASALAWLGDRLRAELPPGAEAAERSQALRFATRFQLLSGPLMAKAFEDTSLYRRHRLVALNEVGGDPRRFATPPERFHSRCRETLRAWPRAMLASATHDTKRGEDVRARLDVLSEIPDAWDAGVRRWRAANSGLRAGAAGEEVPDDNHEYLVYQTLLGTWPLRETGEPETRAQALGGYGARLEGYLRKAVREGKERSSWRDPDPDYETALVRFARGLLDPARAASFQRDFLPWVARVAVLGAGVSLAQTLVRLAAPGVPDVYQGCELWNLALADPDNRRPVDWPARRQALEALGGDLDAHGALRPERVRELLTRWYDGRAKLLLIERLLGLRRREPELFAAGSYHPLGAEGPRAGNVLAFAREHRGVRLVIVVPRLTARLPRSAAPFALGREAWADTGVELPPGWPAGPWRDVVTGAVARASRGPVRPALPVAALLESFPVAALVSVPGALDVRSPGMLGEPRGT